MGLNNMHVFSLFILYASDKFFKGRHSKMILNSFLKNYIDPVGKYYHENMKHIRLMYETVARHSIRLDDKEKNQKQLERNLRKSTQVLLENDILVKEFSKVRLNFDRLLQVEEKRALDKFY